MVHDGRPDTHGESLAFLDVGNQGVKVPGDVVAGPVEDWSFRQIGQVTRQLGELAVEDQSNTGELVTVVEPDPFTSPLRLHPRPCRGLQERS